MTDVVCFDDLDPQGAEMTDDVEEMERMIGGYLAFARGEGAEQAEETNLTAVLEEVAAGARRAGARVALDAPEVLRLSLRAALRARGRHQRWRRTGCGGRPPRRPP